MLIVALIGAFLLYVFLCFFYQSAVNVSVQQVPFMTRLHDIILSVPEEVPLALLKWAIMMFAFYLVGDAIVSIAKKRRRANAK